MQDFLEEFEYDYSYEDWLQGILMPDNIYVLLGHGKIDYYDFEKITKEQDEAYYKCLCGSIEALKEEFHLKYSQSLVKHEYLIYHIRELTAILNEIKTDDEGVYVSTVINSNSEERNSLTKQQVNDLLNYNRFEDFYFSVGVDMLYKFSEFSTGFKYVLLSNYLQWVIWFKEQEATRIAEPAINPLFIGSQPDSASLPKELKRATSYKWLSNPKAELPELYQSLIDSKLIDPDTTKEQFEAVFTAQPLHVVKAHPIKWHDDNASELLYFILQLESTESIEAGKQTNYQRLKACFVKPDGSLFESVFKTLKQRVDIELSEQKQQTIRGIINSFL